MEIFSGNGPSTLVLGLIGAICLLVYDTCRGNQSKLQLAALIRAGFIALRFAPTAAAKWFKQPPRTRSLHPKLTVVRRRAGMLRAVGTNDHLQPRRMR